MLPGRPHSSTQSGVTVPNRPSLDNDYPDVSRSLALLDRAERLIPSATQTLAKGPSQHVRGASPVFVTEGYGSRVIDADENEYIDFTMGVGPLILGYRNSTVDDAIRTQLLSGITFSLVHPLELEVAETIARMVPNAEMIRFSKTGADVTSAAVRLARAHTRRDRVLCCGYHGWHDWYIAVTARDGGIPDAVADLTNTFGYNDSDALLDAIDTDVACVILEPIVFESPRPGFLHDVRRLCSDHGVVLIFDEMWTGFRISPGGAQHHFGVDADLACFSKAVANGMPLSVLTGRREIMRRLDDDVFFYTTFGGEALSLAAAKATLQVLEREMVPAVLGARGNRLREGVQSLIANMDLDYVTCIGYPQRTMLAIKPPNGVDALVAKSFMQQEMIRCGILWSGFHNLSYAHTDDDIDYLIEAYREILPRLDMAIHGGNLAAELRGSPVAPVFRRTSEFNMKPVRTREVSRLP